MIRWRDLPPFALDLVGRAYGLFFLAIGVLFTYWTARGLIAYASGVRTAWSDPLACGAGAVIAVFSFWAGARVVRGGIPSVRLFSGRGTSPELDQTLEEAMRLERTDPAAAQQLLDSYFMREAAATNARREDLRRRAAIDVEAAVALRRELAEELANNAELKKDMLKRMSEGERGGMLGEIETSNRQLEVELSDLERTIGQRRLP